MSLKGCFNEERFKVMRPITNKHHEWYSVPIDWILNDLRKDQNVICIFVGRQGSGKSYLSFLIAWLFNKYHFKKDPALTIEDIYWDIPSFSKAMITLKNQFIVLEETSLQLSSKSWFKDTNQIFNKIIDIFRVSRVSLCLNLPYLLDLDKGTRTKGNYLFVTSKRGNKVVIMDFHVKRLFSDTTKAYYDELGWTDVPMIPKGEFDYNTYEKMKRSFNKDKFKEFKDTLTGKKEGKDEGITIDLPKLDFKL